jgi:hypothetical protein
MARTFKQLHLDESPPWMRDGKGETLLRAQGEGKDALMHLLRWGVKARFPMVAPPDALTLAGQERQLERGPSDTDAVFAARLVAAWEAWEFAGTPASVLNALWDAGYTSPPYLMVANGLRHTLNGARQLVSEANGAPQQLWHLFVLYFHALPAAWASGGIPEAHSAEANLIRRLVRRWKSTHSLFAKVTVRVSGNIWGAPTTTWGASTWGGSVVTWAPIDGLAWGFPETQTWGGGLAWGTPSSPEE